MHASSLANGPTKLHACTLTMPHATPTHARLPQVLQHTAILTAAKVARAATKRSSSRLVHSSAAGVLAA